MTPQDLQTCRAWCAANGVTIEEVPYNQNINVYRLAGLSPALPSSFFLSAYTEEKLLEHITRRLLPIIQSVRNLDAADVPGPYKACESVSGFWFVQLNGLSIAARLPEPTARTIANLLNRECGAGK